VLLRTVGCLEGELDLVLECEPAFDYGRQRGTWRYAGSGYGVAKCVSPDHGQIRLTTDLRVGFEGPLALARHRLRAGQQVFCALSWEDGAAPGTFAEAKQRMAVTAGFWHEWIGRGQFPDHPWREYLVRSALTLKGLTYAPTGALLAAATTSLPETPGGERNYDYRYSWLRDSTYMLWALHTLGLGRDASDFYYFITDLAEGHNDLQIMYGIGGERELAEQTLDHLSGYDGARPVRIGNGAWDQRQHDALCEKLLSYASPLHLYAEEIDHHSGQHLGNFPQAFSHLALINAVMHLIREDERAGDLTSQTAC
jgi:alpha,alpha-trehalase